MSDTTIEARVRGYIVTNYLLTPETAPARDASLLNEGIIDSTGYLEVFQWLRDEFGIVVAPDEMGTDNFETVAHIAAYIARKRRLAGRRGAVSEALRDGFFFDAAGARLYGFMHPALGPAKPVACVIVHPFMEERQDAHAVLRSLAVALAARAARHAPLRPLRLRRLGGRLARRLARALVRDVAAAADLLRREAKPAEVALVGLRFGATLAGLAAGRAGASRVCLAQPVVRGAEYADELLLAHLAAEMVLHRKAGTTREALAARLAAGETVNLFGYDLTGALDREIRAVDLARAMAAGAARAGAGGGPLDDGAGVPRGEGPRRRPRRARHRAPGGRAQPPLRRREAPGGSRRRAHP